MRRIRRWFLLFVLAVVPLFAQGVVPVPELAGRVRDLTDTLTPAQIAELTRASSNLENRKGSQIAILMLRTTGEETIEQYGIRLAEQWKIGRKGIDDGVILIVAKEDRKLRIEVGYGLEGVLTDATAKRIIEESITPLFKEDNFFGGISVGMTNIIKVIDGEPLPPRSFRYLADTVVSGIKQLLLSFMVCVGAFLAVLILGIFLPRRIGRILAPLVLAILWTLIIFLGFESWIFAVLIASAGTWAAYQAVNGFENAPRSGRSGRSGGSRGWSSSSSKDDNDDDSGFSGGGGSFGGGGASGSW